MFKMFEFIFKITGQSIRLRMRFAIKTRFFNTRLSPMFLYSAKRASASKATTHSLNFDIKL
jgi:hypothetical protein